VRCCFFGRWLLKHRYFEKALFDFLFFGVATTDTRDRMLFIRVNFPYLLN
jgi:hypothetical protein